jgi:quercetin 2,3-dioxygenase
MGFAVYLKPMITLRRAEERHHDRSREQEVRPTFSPHDGASPFGDGFGTLEVLDESRLPPGGGIARRPRRDAEIVTFVREGTLAWEDSMDGSGLVQAGEFRRMTAGRGIRHRETNASRTDWAHVFQVWLRPAQPDLEPSHEQKRFSAAERRGRLCVVGSPDGRRGSLRIHQDALLYSALLEPGTHVVHELAPGRSAWLHLVEGEVTLGDLVLTTGDGAGVRGEHAVSLTAEESTEILLLDLREPLARHPREELP